MQKMLVLRTFSVSFNYECSIIVISIIELTAYTLGSGVFFRILIKYIWNFWYPKLTCHSIHSSFGSANDGTLVWEDALRIDKGSRCVLRCTSKLLITLLVFVVL